MLAIVSFMVGMRLITPFRAEKKFSMCKTSQLLLRSGSIWVSFQFSSAIILTKLCRIQFSVEMPQIVQCAYQIMLPWDPGGVKRDSLNYFTSVWRQPVQREVLEP